MKNYVRSFYGIIFKKEQLALNTENPNEIVTFIHGMREHVTIVKESNQLTGLLMVGDLIRYQGNIIEVKEITAYDRMYSIKDCDEIYFKKVNTGNYILSIKRDENGKWVNCQEWE